MNNQPHCKALHGTEIVDVLIDVTLANIIFLENSVQNIPTSHQKVIGTSMGSPLSPNDSFQEGNHQFQSD
jgi:hypothetical protein